MKNRNYILAFSKPIASVQSFVVLLLRKTYHLMPFSNPAKIAMKGWLYRNFPSLFSHTLSYRFWKSNKSDSASTVSINGGLSDYELRVSHEMEVFAKRINVHDLPAIFDYWSSKHLLHILKEAGFETVQGFFASHLLASSIRTGNEAVRFASVGAGNCDLEVNVAKELRELGCADFVIECLEINQAMLDRGREFAKQEGVQDYLQFVKTDFNTWKPVKIYDAVMANQSLHHVTNLEHLFGQIHKNLHDKGSFVICDVIGRNGHQRWPEALAEVHNLWKELPRSHTYNHLLSRFEPIYENWDCSVNGFEGIRAQDILPLLLGTFEFEKFIAYGNVTDIFLDRAFGHNFDPANEWDRSFIDRAHAIDEAGITSGRLTPMHLFGVVQKSKVTNPFYSSGLNPRSCVRRSPWAKRWPF